MAASLFIADPTVPDNSAKPVSFESEDGEEVVFAISQSRSSSKSEGQDAIATSLRGRWECCVLCDGHDLHGHLVARGICEVLATVLLDKLEHKSLDSVEAEQAIIDAFQECESRVMWSNAVLQANSFVRVIEGEWAGQVGYVSEVHDADDTFSIIVVDSEAYHRPRLPRGCLTGSRFVGGSTCVAFIRDSQANLVRVAVMGDTRALVIGCSKDSVLERDPIWENLGKGTFLTFPHDVFNTAELARLKQEWAGEYEIDGPYLINPLTGCEIQPTRGFGDFDMFGTGYLSIPDVSQAFPLDPGAVILVASDGIFDDQVWEDFTLIRDHMQTQIKLGFDLEQIAASLHLETVTRSKQGGYVDDISFFMCRHVPPASPQIADRKVSHHHGGIPRPPGRSLQAESGVEGLPTPSSSFISTAGAFAYQPGSTRESATLSEIAQSRRISHHEAGVLGGVPVTFSSPVMPSNTSRIKRHSTADFIDPNTPRYLKEHRRSSLAAVAAQSAAASQHQTSPAVTDDTIRRTRGPSFMLPDGIDDGPFGPGIGDIAMDLAIIGEETELDFQGDIPSTPPLSGTTPADQLRNAIANKKKRASIATQVGGAIEAGFSNGTENGTGASSAVSTSVATSAPSSPSTHHQTAPRPSMNAVLQRMAARYGHDPKQLDSLVRDLSVV